MEGLFSWIFKKQTPQAYRTERQQADEMVPLSDTLTENVVAIYRYFAQNSDLVIKEMELSGVRCAFAILEGMVDAEKYAKLITRPITEHVYPTGDADAVLRYLRRQSALAAEQTEVHTFSDLLAQMMSGSVVLLLDGVNFAIAYNIPGFAYRSVSEPSSEVNLRGSREGFTEPIKVNITMIRRRMKSPQLQFEMMQVGKESRTSLCLVYRKDKVSGQLLDKVRHALQQVTVDVVLDSGYLIPFLESRPKSIFRSVGTTERPDTLCGKIAEGRIGILLDGTPFALIVPYLFNENFQNLDDYSHSTYYAAFIRILKYISIFITMLLPGLYVAIGSFHPELFPNTLLFNIATAEDATPFPIAIEALIIHFMYEIMREAGLRLPRPVGHAVSIVGALVIGDAAVTAGIVSAPMIMVVALTALSSYVVPALYEPVTILKFIFIVVGGMLGLFGVMVLFAVVCVNILSMTQDGVPIASPLAPFSAYAQRDTVLRVSWKEMAKRNLKIQDLPGSALREKEE